MANVPELKQKKLARDAKNEKTAKEAAAAAVKEEGELNKAIFAKAKAYEEEYDAV